MQAKLDDWDNLKNILKQNFNWQEINSLIERERNKGINYIRKVEDKNEL